jgi:short-subunit dehydrogenase
MIFPLRTGSIVTQKRIGIITGASSGLGVEFAKQVDAAYELDEIWLLARREANLKATSDLMKKAKGLVLPLDLRKKEDIRTLGKKLEEERPDIKILVNNAGYAKKGNFEAIDLEKQLDMIDVNVRAVVHMSHMCLKYMQKGAHIINVSSIAAFFVLSSFTTYGATKAFILDFSYNLRKTLKPKGIYVTACAPGPVKTEFFQVATEGKDDGMILMVEPQPVVALALKDVARNKKVSIYGAAMKVGYALRSWEPKDPDGDD